jgi:hypothetical protein
MMEPLPNCRSIWAIALSTARVRSVCSAMRTGCPSRTRVTAFALALLRSSYSVRLSRAVPDSAVKVALRSGYRSRSLYRPAQRVLESISGAIFEATPDLVLLRRVITPPTYDPNICSNSFLNSTLWEPCSQHIQGRSWVRLCRVRTCKTCHVTCPSPGPAIPVLGTEKFMARRPRSRQVHSSLRSASPSAAPLTFARRAASTRRSLRRQSWMAPPDLYPSRVCTSPAPSQETRASAACW